ncbi:protein FAM177A1-like isoform X1 [Syngnathus typhle]|uniref:protein FAM177A1-like isoform X1 n=1 Tax=Syngnathus typhle TaxID=161592 RepID=UPI002A6B6945|nr:protein FAM177A1-like isoform X1 [Syngnathus typhle]
MGDVPLYLTNINVSRGQNVDVEPSSQIPNPKPIKDSENVKLGDVQREKTPRRIIHFANGETMEEYSTDEEEEEVKVQERKDLLNSVDAERSKMTWGPYFWFHMWKAATSTISACDYLGERMASFFGITSAKYQYAIDEYYKIKKEREEEEESRLSEEAEHSITRTELPAIPPNVTYKIQNENQEAW